MASLQHIQANGIRFAYLEEGEGPLVLLLHGFPDTAHGWDHARPRIAEKGFRVVSPFLRGYHPTEVPSRDTDADTLAKDVIALIDAFGEDQAIVVGHDWGAVAALGAATYAPSRISKLVTIAIPHPLAVKPSLALAYQVRHFFVLRMPGAAARFRKNDFAALDELYRRWSPGWRFTREDLAPVRDCFSNRESLDAALGYYRKLSPFLPAYMKKKIEMPSVAFGGWEDPAVKPPVFEAARRLYRGDYQVEAMAGGHFLHREHPDEFLARLLNHLS